jgi:UDP-N-acetylmuramate--alanine ligase
MDINLSKIKHIHFIGIGGIGISAIARMMMLEKKVVTGQDMQDSNITSELQTLGATITIGQSVDTIPKDAELIVYTIAIEKYDPSLFEKLKRQPIPMRSYPEMLHIVTEGKYTIAISGTHGKTTTTAMLADILVDAHLDPTVVVGSLLVNGASKDASHGTNLIAGKSKYFVVEACEYRRSFLNINPNILVITNIDADHLDYYKDIEDIKSAFRELAMKVPTDGFIVCDPDAPYVKEVVEGVAATVVNYNPHIHLSLQLKVPGLFNKKNAAAAKAVAHILAVTDAQIGLSLGAFKGTWRRFEFKGTLPSGALVYDDYAHHPTEITATLQGFRELYPKDAGWKVTVVFQPHLFSRTKALLSEFAASFIDADYVLVLPIYQAREEDDGTISAASLSEQITGPFALAFGSFEEAEMHIGKQNLGPKDIIVTMGAGEAFKIADNLLKEIV